LLNIFCGAAGAKKRVNGFLNRGNGEMLYALYTIFLNEELRIFRRIYFCG
jgi:hypothetical protein